MDFFSIPFLGFLSNCCVLWEWFFKPSKGIKLTHQRNQQLPEKWMFSLEGFSSDKYYKYWYGKGFLPIFKNGFKVRTTLGFINETFLDVLFETLIGRSSAHIEAAYDSKHTASGFNEQTFQWRHWHDRYT